MVITWNTTKTSQGFEFNVYTVGFQVPSQTLKTGVCSSRAKAVLQAKKWVRYFKADETLDKLYLEWSQFTNAMTRREKIMQTALNDILFSDSYKFESAAAHIDWIKERAAKAAVA